MSLLYLSLLWILNPGYFQSQTKLPNETGTSMYAVVKKVEISGKEGNYAFSVTLKSSDTGCKQYADWWEVLSEDGELIYRRILLHSHVDEQPFTRSGGLVDISADQMVIVRAHMNTIGYGEGEVAMKGSPQDGFKPFIIKKSFAEEVEKQAPLPNGCAF